MRTTTALLVALAAASVSGTPTAIKRQDESEEVYESWPSKEKYCDWDLSTPESVEDRWDGYVIDATMDAFLRTYDHDVGESLPTFSQDQFPLYDLHVFISLDEV